MRITFVLPYAGLAGGIRVVAIYAKHLAERGHEVVVVSQPMARVSWYDQARSFLRRGRFARISNNSPSHLDGVPILHRVLESNRPVTDNDVPDADVVVATWWETAEWVARLSPAKGAKAYFIQHHEVFDYLPKDRVKATWRLPLHKITISQWLVDLARDEYGDATVTWVPNSVDTQQFHAPSRGRQPVPTVGLMYAAVSWKGCAVSLAALSLASQKVPGIQLVSFGTLPPDDALPLPPGTQYHLCPPQEQLRDIYARCDVWMCGSYAEGFGLPILEAMACRCPVVSTRVGGAIDLIKHGVNGYIAPVGDSRGLADYLIAVFSKSEVEWLAMSNAAHETAIGYTWYDATDRFEEGLRYAVERHRSGEL